MAVLHRLLEPGTRYLQRLDFTSKARLILLVFLLPIVLLGSTLTMSFWSSQSFTQRELDGTFYLARFAPLNKQLLIARNSTRAQLGGFDAAGVYQTSKSRFEALSNAFEVDLAVHGDPMNLRAAWRDLQQQWHATASAEYGVDKTTGRTVFGSISAANVRFLSQLADDSGLMLDPDIDTLYLSLLATQVMPELMENLGQVWGWSTYLAAKGDAITYAELTLARNRFTAWDERVHEELSTYAKYMAKVVAYRPALQNQLNTGFLAKVERFQAMARQAAMENADTDTQALWQSGQAVFDDVVDAQDEVLLTLSGLLQARLHNMRVNHALLALVTVLTLALAMYFFFSFYRSMVRDMAQQVRDEEQLRQAKTLAEQASVAKSQFLATMSHELRTPMNGILGMLALLKSTALTSKQLDYANKSESSANSLLVLLNGLLDFSKIEANKMTLDEHSFSIHDLLNQVAVILHANATNPAVALRFDMAPDLPEYVLGDDQRLGQVLINLGGNALKFTSAGEVLVRIGVAERTAQTAVLQFSVKDTGIGIAPEHQSKIFDGFSQAESSTTRRYGGTGLGLVISTKLVDLMGGQLTLNSAPGQGSTFAFSLTLGLGHAPLQTTPSAVVVPADSAKASPCLLEQAAQDAVTIEPVAPDKPLCGLRLLLVEDNFINQQIALELLGNAGAELTVADNGRIAVDKLMAQPQAFDLVLMDLQMPVLGGLEATREIRQHISATLPIVAMTANALESDRAACLEAGMNEHVGKPFKLDALVGTILRLLQRQV